MSADEIRALTPQDASAVEKILSAVHLSSTVPIGPRWSSQQVAEECRGLGWGLFDANGRMNSFVLLRDVVNAWEISFLATQPDAQGGGKMRKLLTYLLTVLPPDRALWLEVHERNNAARQLYRTMGFEEVGQRPKYYSDGGAAILYNYR